MPLPIEDYALLGDRHTAALVGTRRLHRLALPAPLRLPGLLRRAARHRRPRPLAAGARRASTTARGATSATPASSRPRSRHRHRRRHRHGPDAARRRPRRRGPQASQGVSRHRRACTTSGWSASTTARSGRGCGARTIGGRRGDHRRSPGPTCWCSAAPRLPKATDGHARRTTFDVSEGDELVFSTTWFPSHSSRPGRAGPRRPDRATRIEVAEEWAARCAVDVPARRRRPCARCSRCAAADPRGDRRDRRRPDHLAARGLRRRAQLGLPLLLAARRRAHPRVAARGRLHRGGRALARLAAARHRRRPARTADHVRRRRLAAAARARARPPARLRRLPAGPDRQRRGRPEPDRRARRGDGRPRARPRQRESQADARRLAAAARPGRTSWPSTGSEPDHGLWEIRGPTQALHALAGDGLGRLRPRGPGDRGPRPRRARRGVAAAARRGPRGDARARASTPSAAPSCSTTAPPRSTRRCCSCRSSASSTGDDPRMLGTIAAVEEDLLHDGLVLRYRTETGVDGLAGRRAPVPRLLVLAGLGVRRGRAPATTPHALFDRLVGLANDVGLLSEEYDPVAGGWPATSRRRSATSRWCRRRSTSPTWPPAPTEPPARRTSTGRRTTDDDQPPAPGTSPGGRCRCCWCYRTTVIVAFWVTDSVVPLPA